MEEQRLFIRNQELGELRGRGARLKVGNPP
jgi:hypothetical protein